MKRFETAVLAIFLSAFPILAQHSHEHHNTETKQMRTNNVFSKGVVKGIDFENKKITIEHEAIEVLSWPAMTMRFTFEDENLVKDLKEGDSIEFLFVQQGKISLLKSVKKI
ncbi:MAG: copper-binding protein [Campylobacteraceae bacterium]|jgi:Cu(I)/Ag(I) efflux system protein CusF|nr:copper-binding protein [Campylobacteraceae bacterium]